MSFTPPQLLLNQFFAELSSPKSAHILPWMDCWRPHRWVGNSANHLHLPQLPPRPGERYRIRIRRAVHGVPPRAASERGVPSSDPGCWLPYAFFPSPSALALSDLSCSLSSHRRSHSGHCSAQWWCAAELPLRYYGWVFFSSIFQYELNV